MASQGDKEAQYKSILPKLPTNTSWAHNFTLYEYKSFWYVPLFLEGTLEAQKLDQSEFNLSPSDIVICTTLKSGTTWLKALAFSIATRIRFNPFSEGHPFFTSNPHELIPFIEIDIAQNHTPRDPNLPLLATHMPYSALPDSILASGCKFVYIARNPKDVFVSLWHFLPKVIPGNESISLDKAFDLFCKGISLSGPYWDHVLEYWKTSLDHPERILFLKYEDMINDVEFYVKKLSGFMGYPFSDEEERDGVVKRIVEMCSFDNLSNLEVNKTGKQHEELKSMGIRVSNATFFRKAKVEDWRNYLTEEMANKLDEITIEKFVNSGLTL